MNNINKYSTSKDYQAAILSSNVKPSISYAEDINFIYFNEQQDNETDDKRFARVGDWVLAKEDGSKLFVGDKVYQSKYKNSEDWTAIAKVVVPYNAFGDKTIRCCSLVKMDYDTPETGSTSGKKMKWGDNKTSVPNLPNRANRYLIIPGTTTVTAGVGNAYVASDIFGVTPSLDNRAFYHEAYNSSHVYSIPVYNGDKPWDFLKTISEDYTNGKPNTELIAAAITADISGDAITNSSDPGNYPAASCCLRFHTVGTSAGDWYLPSIYELVFMYSRSKLIGIDMQSTYYWSSTQSSSPNAYYLATNNKYLVNYNKTNNLYVCGFVAF